MKAAQDFGLNAYYIAAKIRQENGGATASATAVNGSTSPFQGIYNYFNNHNIFGLCFWGFLFV